MATTWNRFKGPGHEEEESRTSEEYKRGLEARITVHSATSNRRGGKGKTGKNKKNAFVMFMEEKRPEVEAAGRKLARGLADLAIILSDDWKKLAPEKKAVYEERSRKYNGEAAAQKKEENSSPAHSKPNKKDIMLPGEFKEAYQLRMEREQWVLEFERKRKDNRDIVWDIFETTNWSSKQIVVCSVSLFFKPCPKTLLHEFIPAEIGLAAFSLQDGLVDNFARLIDPSDDIPADCGIEAAANVEKMGLPKTGSCEELRQYKTLLAEVECFLQKYAGNPEAGYHVFALNNELEKVTRCLEWICEVAGRSIRFKVLSLSMWAQLASTETNIRYRQERNFDPADPSSMESVKLLEDRMKNFMGLSLVTLATSSNRTAKKSLTTSFHYPSAYPLVEYGLFLAEPSVDVIVGTTDNYKYFEELCCMYHMKRRDGIKYCAMNTANRYVYCLLEILTRSNTVDNLRPGFHFPAISGRLNVESEERRIRLASLARWGFTQLELDMNDETYKMQRDVQEEEERCNRIQANMRRNPVENPRRTCAGQGRAPEPARDLRRGRGFPDVDRVNQTPTEDLPEMLPKGLD